MHERTHGVGGKPQGGMERWGGEDGHRPRFGRGDGWEGVRCAETKGWRIEGATLEEILKS